MVQRPPETQLTIRLANITDAAGVALAASATFLETYAHMIRGDDIAAHVSKNHSVATYTACITNPACRIWVAQTTTGAIIGYLVLAPASLPDEYPHPDDLEVTRIYVLSRFQKTGLGHALMSQALAEARARHARQLVLGVFRGNEKALSFYGRQGFTQIATRLFSVGTARFDDFVLAKTISLAHG